MAEHVNEPVPGVGAIAAPVATVGGQSASQVTQDATQVAGIIFPSAARLHTTDSGVYTSDEMHNPGARGVRLFIVVANGSGTVTVKLQVRDPNTDAWVDIPGATTAALNNTTGTLMTVYPGLTGIVDAATNVNQVLGPAWRVIATVATATETFSVGADYLI